MKKILILFAHPKFEKSRANLALVDRIKEIEGITFHDLYEQYPNFNVDVVAEQSLLDQHDVIIWHHPFYWYSCPPLMKQWIDMVLEFNWAYGPQGKALHGKTCLNVLTTGGSKEVYCSEGYNSFTVSQFLRPFEQTANLCGMMYLPPFAVMGTHNLTVEKLTEYAHSYGNLIELLKTDISVEDSQGYSFLNDIPKLKQVKL